jgi:cytochrome c-type biogenesis protein CcmH
MLLWLCFAFLTAAVVALLLQPLRRAPVAPVGPAEADLAVYRDQLRELDAETERGLFAKGEIEGARAEIARRLIKRAATGEPQPLESGAGAGATGVRTIYAAIAAILPVAGIALYLATGSPNLPARPFAGSTTTTADGQPPAIIALIAQVEQRLRDQPQDGKGWDVIAPVYLRLGRYADAAHAFAEANRLLGESVRRLLGFAEATLLAGNGVVTEPVRRAALRVLELEPQRKEVRAWLILAREQDGDLAGAAEDYRNLLADAPADAPWRVAVSDRLALVERKLKGETEPVEPATQQPAPAPPAAQTPPAPQGETPDIAAMSPAERDAFIAGMVDRLAKRLETNGQDLDGWMRLARAYKVLGRDDEARSALGRARANFPDDAAAIAEIEKSEQNLGLAAQEPATSR